MFVRHQPLNDPTALPVASHAQRSNVVLRGALRCDGPVSFDRNFYEWKLSIARADPRQEGAVGLHANWPPKPCGHQNFGNRIVDSTEVGKRKGRETHLGLSFPQSRVP